MSESQTRSYGGRLESRPDSSQEVVSPAPPACTHAVEFYEEDSVLVGRLSAFLGSALGSGGACVVIATRKHQEAVAEQLTAWGIDLPFAREANRYIYLDVAETVASFLVDGWPDERLFSAAVEPALLRARSGVAQKTGSIAAFGEMVAVLWAQGRYHAAIRVEQLWNELAQRHSLSLRCAYPISCFAEETQADLFDQVCAQHSSVIPTESYTSLRDEEERSRLVSSLQQKAESLQAMVDARAREIAQRKQVEERLRRSEELVRDVVESSVDSVKVLDLEGRLEYMSPPGQRALEIDDIRPFLGRRWVEMWREEDRPKAEAAVAAAKAGAVGSFHGDRCTQGGVSKSWDVRITPARGVNGEIERLIAVSRDITELRQAQILVMQAEKLAATGRLAATIAHEINNPLEAVTNFIYLAKTSPGVPEEVRRHLEIADQELARVAQIAQQTLGFYRDNSRHRWISLADLIGGVVAIYQRKLRYKRLELHLSVDRELRLYARQGELKQALANLMANAIDASNEGGTLWLRARKTRHWGNGMEEGIRITLADNGVGMPPEVQRRIFVPFFTTKADVGTGIGLWMTKNLVEKQGGTMRFRSRQGEKAGTVMSCFLPLIPDESVNSPLTPL